MNLNDLNVYSKNLFIAWIKSRIGDYYDNSLLISTPKYTIKRNVLSFMTCDIR